MPQSAPIRIDLRNSNLGKRKPAKVLLLDRHKLRKLAIAQSIDERTYFLHDTQPERAVFAPTLLVKGTPIVELAGTASARSGVFLKWVDRHRCLVQITSGVGVGLIVVSDWRCLTLQCQQLSLF